jgi:hypothetical protein
MLATPSRVACHALGAGVLGLHTRVAAEAADQFAAFLAAPEQRRSRRSFGKGGQRAPLGGGVGAEHAVAVADGRVVVGPATPHSCVTPSPGCATWLKRP